MFLTFREPWCPTPTRARTIAKQRPTPSAKRQAAAVLLVFGHSAGCKVCYRMIQDGSEHKHKDKSASRCNACVTAMIIIGDWVQGLCVSGLQDR